MVRLAIGIIALLINCTAIAQTYTWYRDFDTDGWGNPTVSQLSAVALPGYVLNNMDCNDSLINPADWTYTADTPISDGRIDFTTLAFDRTGTAYVSYIDNFNGYRPTVKKINGTIWTPVGPAGISVYQVFTLRMAIDTSNIPYIIYGDINEVIVKYFDGTNWVQLGPVVYTGTNITNNISIAIDGSNMVYVAYIDGGTSKACVKKFDGTNWVIVGSSSFSPGAASGCYLTIDTPDNPVIVFKDAANGNKATVMRFASSNWNIVGTAGFSTFSCDYPYLSIDRNNNIYIAYVYDNSTSSFAHAMKYDGSTWADLSSGAIGPTGSGYRAPHIRTDSAGGAYMLVGNSSVGGQCYAYNGTTWIKKGNNISGYGTSLAIGSMGIPHIASAMYAIAGQKLGVVKLDRADNPPTTPSVSCTPNTLTTTTSVQLKVDTGTLNDAANWYWYADTCGGTLVGTGSTLTITPTATTYYYCRGEGGNCLTTPGSCGNTSVIFVSVKDVYLSKAIRIYPNPATDVLNIQLKSKGAHTVVVKDLLGKTIPVGYTRQGDDSYNLSVANLSHGLYYIYLYDSHSTLTAVSRFVKE